MEEKLSIIREDQSDLIVLIVSGRIDGYWSKVLEEYLDELIRSGEQHVALDLSGIHYLSSIGIRVLVKYAKQYRQIQGSFGIRSSSDSVAEVLKMAGLQGVLSFQHVSKTILSEHPQNQKETETYQYTLVSLPSREDMVCKCIGEPEKLKTTAYTATDCQTIPFSGQRYGLGLGAIGQNFEDCKDQFGEFAAFGDAVVYSPAGKPGSPDYMIRSGNLIPKIEMLYGILIEGEFSQQIRFTPKNPAHTMAFSTLLSDLQEMSGFERFAMIMLAESAGLVGLSLNNQSIASSDTKPNIFEFPSVRESMIFTTEPGFQNMISLSVGIVCKKDDPECARFTRPVSDHTDIYSHFHSAIFNNHPAKTAQVTLQETVSRLFNAETIQGVLHLIQDNRPLSGVGESEFKNGICWIGRIKS